ncbi:MAG: hypothetical protein UW09_C0001G0031 [candidate division TM6 bacterium GW2011_GWF2_43_87]|nr:MAG: hypothetical protein UW09_C0001G0031 [candidate division TM6 bacterium GW2011_GWF2_43_87]
MFMSRLLVRYIGSLRRPASSFVDNANHEGMKATFKTKHKSLKQRAQLQRLMNLDHDAEYMSYMNGKKNKKISGGADRIRTGGLMNATHALYQLSYSPTEFIIQRCKRQIICPIGLLKNLVELTGFEPVTSWMPSMRSAN